MSNDHFDEAWMRLLAIREVLEADAEEAPADEPDEDEVRWGDWE
jgi:hypothetical protein